MKTLFISLLSLLCSWTTQAQDCNCPTGINNDNEGRPFKTFRFSNGKELGICGYSSAEGKDTTYNLFSLYLCDDKKVIRDWGELQSCTVTKVKDTLVIKQMYGLPLGREFGNIWVPFYIRNIYFKNGEIEDKAYFRKDLKKYSKKEIEQVLAEFNSLSKDNLHQVMHVGHMLFWAYVSGSKQAGIYLESIPQKYGPFHEDPIEGEWGHIFHTYEFWKDMNDR